MDYQPVLGKVVAIRHLEFVGSTGVSEPAVVQVGEPVHPAGGPWWCPYQVKTQSFERTFAMAGEDSMQALILTVHVLSTELKALARQHHGVFKQHGEPDLGFPDMHNIEGQP